MKKIDIAFVVHKKEDPNSRLRIYPVAEEMRKRGWRCDVRDVPKSFMGRVRLFLNLTRTDVILLHKKLFNPLEVRLLKALRKKIIFDFDDAIMYTEARRKQPMTGKFTGRFRKIMEISDVAVAGNEFLANEAKKHCRRVEIMTTPVDVKLFTPAAPENKKNEVVIGWIGLKGNLFYLDALAPVFQNLARKFPGIALSVVCSDFPDIEGIKINKRIWSIENELKFLREMDIGLMPLTDDIWSRGKCGFKILQYFSVGVPVVASPVGINSEIVEHGVNGFLSATNEEWESHLAQLLADKSLREKMGAAGRKAVAEKFALKDYLERYVSLLEGIAGNAGKPA
jgi:glycosyltransferase involved in cell wall biosynthesis